MPTIKKSWHNVHLIRNIYLYAPISAKLMTNDQSLIDLFFWASVLFIQCILLNYQHSAHEIRCHFLAKEKMSSQPANSSLVIICTTFICIHPLTTPSSIFTTIQTHVKLVLKYLHFWLFQCVYIYVCEREMNVPESAI